MQVPRTNSSSYLWPAWTQGLSQPQDPKGPSSRMVGKRGRGLRTFYSWEGVPTNSRGTHMATEQEGQKEGEASPHPGLKSFCGEEGESEGPG